MNTGDRFTTRAGEWHRVLSMNELRDLRRATGLGQREFAAELAVALETFRTWDSGRRPVPAPVLQRARAVVTQHARWTEPLPLDRLACELKVHIRTLVTVPGDYPEQLKRLRRRLRLTQDTLARRIGAAGKAVVYQWESSKRMPSPVFWERILRLERRGAGPVSRRSTRDTSRCLD